MSPTTLGRESGFRNLQVKLIRNQEEEDEAKGELDADPSIHGGKQDEDDDRPLEWMESPQDSSGILKLLGNPDLA